MKYKMTVLYYSKAGNAEALARAIAREQQTKGDQIPPAYPCEAQKLLLIGFEQTALYLAGKYVIQHIYAVALQDGF